MTIPPCRHGASGRPYSCDGVIQFGACKKASAVIAVTAGDKHLARRKQCRRVAVAHCVQSKPLARISATPPKQTKHSRKDCSTATGRAQSRARRLYSGPSAEESPAAHAHARAAGASGMGSGEERPPGNNAPPGRVQASPLLLGGNSAASRASACRAGPSGGDSAQGGKAALHACVAAEAFRGVGPV